MKILFKVFNIPLLGGIMLSKVIALEGGAQESVSLRYYINSKYKVNVGLYSYGGCFDPNFNNGGTVFIGKYCSFASNVRYFGGNHPMKYVSMSPYFYNKSFGKNVRDISRESLIVGHDVWCGYGAIITSKCHKIGNGVVIAAGAVVTSDVPAYAIVAGSPAKILRYRFDEITIKLIEDSKWWERTPDECIEHYEYIDKPDEFCRRINE